jgi:hypothetical protein
MGDCFEWGIRSQASKAALLLNQDFPRCHHFTTKWHPNGTLGKQYEKVGILSGDLLEQIQGVVVWIAHLKNNYHHKCSPTFSKTTEGSIDLVI